jgi:radical SAM protein with 4Fe4S-binding SPASM domain
MRERALYDVPVFDHHLVYAPLHDLTAIVNAPARDAIAAGMRGGPVPAAVAAMIERLRSPPRPEPRPRSGPVRAPLFLGIIPTRSCNLACSYCEFRNTPDRSVMSLDTARAAVDAYFGLMADSADRRREIHFFGGEPLFRSDLVDFVVGYARSLAADLSVQLHLEISTNGFFGEARARSTGALFDSVVLSFDGPGAVQDRNRPAPGGQGTFDRVLRTAEILSDSPTDLVLRSCVTQESLPLLADWATFIAHRLRPSTVCFEPMTSTAPGREAGLRPPDPWEFARQFVTASHLLQRHGITAVTSNSDVARLVSTCCPVGRDALVVSPDGAVDACYLLREHWVRKGLDLGLGRLLLDPPSFRLEPAAVERVRQLAGSLATRCEGCLCRLHCAGGCHVDHRPTPGDEGYDDLCIATRAITIAQLLERAGGAGLAEAWLSSEAEMAATVLQPTDLLGEVVAK